MWQKLKSAAALETKTATPRTTHRAAALQTERVPWSKHSAAPRHEVSGEPPLATEPAKANGQTLAEPAREDVKRALIFFQEIAN
jgi:hypothetical protein